MFEYEELRLIQGVHEILHLWEKDHRPPSGRPPHPCQHHGGGHAQLCLHAEKAWSWGRRVTPQVVSHGGFVKTAERIAQLVRPLSSKRQKILFELAENLKGIYRHMLLNRSGVEPALGWFCPGVQTCERDLGCLSLAPPLPHFLGQLSPGSQDGH